MPKKKGYYLVPGVLDFDPKWLRESRCEKTYVLQEKPGESSDQPESTVKKRALWEAED